MDQTAQTLLTRQLRDVSRSFYLTLRFLPKEIRAPIGVAYLLARATDTIADTRPEQTPAGDSVQARVNTLDALLAAVLDASKQAPALQGFAALQQHPGEARLMRALPSVLSLMRGLPLQDRELIQEVLRTITKGQRLDLTRFATATESRPVALATETELDEYTYLVAGCVGEFWTKMCLAHLQPLPGISPGELLRDGVFFGKGLQLVNILRDVPKDLRNGRCYLPADKLHIYGTEPSSLLDPAAFPAIQELYTRYLDLAEGYLQSGWAYTNSLPHQWRRVRLACAWPILIGIGTISKLRKANPLDASRRVKVSRAEVRSILWRSIINLPFRYRWNGLFERQKRAVD